MSLIVILKEETLRTLTLFIRSQRNATNTNPSRFNIKLLRATRRTNKLETTSTQCLLRNINKNTASLYTSTIFWLQFVTYEVKNNSEAGAAENCAKPPAVTWLSSTIVPSTWKNSCGPVAGWLARRGMAARAHSSCAIITSQQRITLISAEHFYCRLKAFHGHAWVTLTNCWASRVWLLSGCRAHPGLLQSKETQSKCRANWQHCGGRGAD